MPRKSTSIDPATGKPLPEGVQYRGPDQYRARRMVNGRRPSSTFPTAKAAAAWIEEAKVDGRRGQFRDQREAERKSLGDIIRRYIDEKLGEGTAKLGAKKEREHLRMRARTSF